MPHAQVAKMQEELARMYVGAGMMQATMNICEGSRRGAQRTSGESSTMADDRTDPPCGPSLQIRPRGLCGPGMPIRGGPRDVDPAQ
jgi:hypothetical protein